MRLEIRIRLKRKGNVWRWYDGHDEGRDILTFNLRLDTELVEIENVQSLHANQASVWAEINLRVSGSANVETGNTVQFGLNSAIEITRSAYYRNYDLFGSDFDDEVAITNWYIPGTYVHISDGSPEGSLLLRDLDMSIMAMLFNRLMPIPDSSVSDENGVFALAKLCGLMNFAADDRSNSVRRSNIGPLFQLLFRRGASVSAYRGDREDAYHGKGFTTYTLDFQGGTSAVDCVTFFGAKRRKPPKAGVNVPLEYRLIFGLASTTKAEGIDSENKKTDLDLTTAAGVIPWPSLDGPEWEHIIKPDAGDDSAFQTADHNNKVYHVSKLFKSDAAFQIPHNTVTLTQQVQADAFEYLKASKWVINRPG